jgi:SAM-dependent methyltransferase
MYDDISDIYSEIFPVNQEFIRFFKSYSIAPHAKVLDLGCGPGDYVAQLSRAGYHVTGIDSSESMIQKAKSTRTGVFHNYSFTEITRLEQSFDCSYCIGNSLSYLSEEYITDFLDDLYSLLHHDGLVLLQVINWNRFRETGEWHFPEKKLDRGYTFHRHYQKTGDSSEAPILFRTELRENGEPVNSWEDLLYPKYMEDLQTALTAARLRIKARYGDYKKSPFVHRESPAILVVAQKAFGN